MNTGVTLMDNDLFYEPEDGFWGGTDRLMFEANNLEPEWPKSANVFINKMAEPARLTKGLQKISFADFKQILGSLIETDPKATHRFLVIPLHRSGKSLSIRLLHTSIGESPPLLADNACSLSTAVEWMANKTSHFEVSFTAGGTYWVHKQ